MLINQFAFSETERLVARFDKVRTNPYRDYTGFRGEVTDMIAADGGLRAESGKEHSVTMTCEPPSANRLRRLLGARWLRSRTPLPRRRNRASRSRSASCSYSPISKACTAATNSRYKALVQNQETARQRYLLETYNFCSNARRDQFADLYVPGLVDDAKIDQPHGMTVA